MRAEGRSETPVLAGSSYGIEKQIMELYVYDYGRKGKPHCFMEVGPNGYN